MCKLACLVTTNWVNLLRLVCESGGVAMSRLSTRKWNVAILKVNAWTGKTVLCGPLAQTCFLIWNIIFLAPRIQIIVILNLLWSEVWNFNRTFRSASRVGCLWVDPYRVLGREQELHRKTFTSNNTAPLWIVIRDTNSAPPPSTSRSFCRYLGQVTDN